MMFRKNTCGYLKNQASAKSQKAKAFSFLLTLPTNRKKFMWSYAEILRTVRVTLFMQSNNSVIVLNRTNIQFLNFGGRGCKCEAKK